VLIATPVAQLALTLLLGAFVFLRIVKPLGAALVELGESELQLTLARDDLEQKVHDRTAELEEANETLEKRVLDRTAALDQARAAAEESLAKLSEAQSQLVRLSRQAGMAEVATGVLHNVGNALNSVNVSAELLLEAVQSSQIAGLAKACALLEKNRQDLPGFFSTGSDGEKLVAYLQGLSECLAEERGEFLAELKSMYTGVDHVKTIISRQQSLAKSLCVTESFEPCRLFEEALSFSRYALEQDGIEIVRTYDEGITLSGDRNKLMQILLNLLSNARHAIRAALRSGALDRGEGRLRAVVLRDGDRVHLSVEDNGVGIPQDDLQRIFVHGFTTKPDGHGFGLHSSSLAATELGGQIDVHSDGAGKGARFTILLPLEAATAGRSGDALELTGAGAHPQQPSP
jgi:signal transduction histidine kinase